MSVLSVVGCSRAKEESTKISISLPSQQKAGVFTACTTCLKFIAINVSGPGIAHTIYAKKEQGNFQQAGTEITDAFIEIEVPVGLQRQIQMIAAYKSPTSEIEIKHGITTADLVSGDVTIELPLTSAGTFQGGHIAGRYLTGTSDELTGLVDIKITPVQGMPKFTLLRSSIAKGWFDFFASKNFKMTYTMSLTGVDIFSEVTLDDILPAVAASTASTQVARVVRPASYYRFDGSAWISETEDSADIVYGFFFAPGVSDPNKRVCKSSSTTNVPFSNLRDATNTSQLNYNASGNAGDVRVYGGHTYASHASCVSNPGQQFESDNINLNIDQFDGNGNDHAKSIEGVFSYFMNAGQITKYVLAGNTYSFKVMPDIFSIGGFANSVKLFRSTATITNSDNLFCTQASLDQHGFTEVTLAATPSVSGTSLSVTTAASVSGGNLMVCPTLAGYLRGFGGMYLGSPSSANAVLNISGTPPYNFGTIATGGVSASNLFTVTNTGSVSATSISEVGLAAPFSFVGGSFPGTSGTCGATLAASNTCTINVQFSPASTGAASDAIDLQYNNGLATVNATFSVSGTGANPAMLVISDGPTYDFGNITSLSSSTYTFTITNTGSVAATAVADAGGLAAPFDFNGAAFPGGGTCTSTLAAGASCAFVVRFSPMAISLFNDTIDIMYNNGVTVLNVTRDVMGTGL